MPLRASVSRRRSPRRSGTAPARSCSSSRTRCDEYGSAGWRFAVLLAGLAFAGLAAFAPPLEIWIYLAAQAIALGAGHCARAHRRRTASPAARSARRRRASPSARGAPSPNTGSRARKDRRASWSSSRCSNTAWSYSPTPASTATSAPTTSGRRSSTSPSRACARVARSTASTPRCAAAASCSGATCPAPDHNPNELPDRVVLED